MAQNVIGLDGIWKVAPLEVPEGGSIDYLQLLNSCNWIDSHVPGDIHNDLYISGMIPDPYYSDNCKKCSWITEKDWVYFKEFTLPEGFKMNNTHITFKGIDIFSSIWLNGVRLGDTDNMFLEYSFDISNIVREDSINQLFVHIKPVKKIMDTYSSDDYSACFNTNRIFIRKAQCHFGWDWAPEFPGAGICNSVVLTSDDGQLINDVNIDTRINGNVVFKVELERERNRPGAVVDSVYEVLIRVLGDNSYEKAFPVQGRNNLFIIKIPDPRLWWPNGYGEQFLYNYEVILLKNSLPVHRKSGRFGIREVNLVQEPGENGKISFVFHINNVPVFAKGANWVPLDSMTGIITEDKYLEMILKASQANFNMFRVWGGGIYEKDVFYELCDRYGIMVWQDFMFACADMPDDHPWFVEKIVPEFEYQIKRLRNYPSIVYWCGCNERPSGYGVSRPYGDNTLNYLLRGICNHLDSSRPYGPSSPYSFTDLGDDYTSGDAHCTSYYTAIKDGINAYRDKLKTIEAGFLSEIAVQGPSRMASLKKFIPEDKLWPISDIWDAHFVRNPYDGFGTTFVQQQQQLAKDAFGEYDNVHEFVKKGMSVHAEFVKSEIEFHRSRKKECGGLMFWMYSDIWPCGTWALVDYYGAPKPAYYAAKRAFKPLIISIVERIEGIKIFITNDMMQGMGGIVEYGQASVNGTVLWSSRIVDLNVDADSCIEVADITDSICNSHDTYLFARFNHDEGVESNTYFHFLWKTIEWPEPSISSRVIYYTKSDAGYKAVVEVSTEKYARMVNLSMEDDGAACYSDNFFDMEAGSRKQIEIISDKPFDPGTIKIDHWLTEWR